MVTDHRRPGEPGRPMGIDAERMIMGGVADGAINLAGESLGGDAAGAAPAAFERAASERSVAGVGELDAASGLPRALVNDAADAAWSTEQRRVGKCVSVRVDPGVLRGMKHNRKS